MFSETSRLNLRNPLSSARPSRGAFRRIRLEASAPASSETASRDSDSASLRQVTPADLERRILQNAEILETARPHLEWVVRVLSDIGAVVYLVDREGILLWSAGPSQDLIDEAGANPGRDWSEEAVGPNTAGSALAADAPVYGVGGEQGEPSWRRYSAMAVPLHFRDGNIAAVAVVASLPGSGQDERLALAAYAAFAVEGHLGGDEGPGGESTLPSADARRRQDEAGRFRRLLDAAPDATVLVDESGTILFANARVQTVLGYTPVELLGRPVEHLVPERLRELHLRHRKRFFREPRAQSIGANFELYARRRDGSEIPVEINLSPVRMREGLLVSTGIRDITARKEAIARLEIQYSLSCALAESPGIAEAAPRLLEAIVRAGGWDAGELWLVDAPEKSLRMASLWVSPSLKEPDIETEMQEFALEEGRAISGRVWEEAAPVFVSNLTEGNAATTDARSRPSLRSAFGFPINLGQKVIGVLAFFSRGIHPLDDETLRMLTSLGNQVGQFIERRHAEEDLRASEARLQASEARLRLMTEQAPVALWTTDRELRLTSASGGLLEDLGVRVTDVLGLQVADICGRLGIGDVPDRAAAQALGGQMVDFESKLCGRALASRAEPLRNRQGEIVGVVGVVFDVTDRKRAEEEAHQLNAELERRVQERTVELEDALREMNAFSYTIAHDLRSPLRTIASGTDIILEESENLGEEAREWGRRINEEATRMDELVSGLLDYSRLSRQEIRLEPVQWEHVVTSTLTQLEREIREKGAQIVVDGPLPRVQGHTLTLTQALANLISNAIKFVARGVVPQVRIRAERLGAGRIRLWVEDNGIGIAPDHRDRIFGVFERLHRRENYPGTGIGLAIVKRVLDRMGGKVGVESEPGRGSRFYLDLQEA
ncbi:MAG TPA: PAS domain S-box protein [Planctomycetota bacterium]|nr:PAS domain S-box protein [Planctomycetota bacterium]